MRRHQGLRETIEAMSVVGRSPADTNLLGSIKPRFLQSTSRTADSQHRLSPDTAQWLLECCRAPRPVILPRKCNREGPAHRPCSHLHQTVPEQLSTAYRASREKCSQWGRSSSTADCPIKIDWNGYVNFRLATLNANQFRRILRAILQSIKEVIDLNLGLFQNVAESRAFDRSMGRNSYFQSPIRQRLLKPDVATALSNFDEAEPHKCGHNPLVALRRNFAHHHTPSRSVRLESRGKSQIAKQREAGPAREMGPQPNWLRKDSLLGTHPRQSIGFNGGVWPGSRLNFRKGRIIVVSRLESILPHTPTPMDRNRLFVTLRRCLRSSW